LAVNDNAQKFVYAYVYVYAASSLNLDFCVHEL